MLENDSSKKIETDEEIILSHKNGNPEAFRSLIYRYTSPLYNFAARLTGKDNASDITQEIFIKAWKHLGRFDPGKASFKTWIFTIGRNATMDFLRKKKSVVFSDMRGESDEYTDSFEENIPDSALVPDEALQKLQDREFLNDLLNKLKPAYREILMLHYQEEMTFSQIGKILHKPLNTVKSQHRRAILELRKFL